MRRLTNTSSPEKCWVVAAFGALTFWDCIQRKTVEEIAFNTSNTWVCSDMFSECSFYRVLSQCSRVLSSVTLLCIIQLSLVSLSIKSHPLVCHKSKKNCVSPHNIKSSCRSWQNNFATSNTLPNVIKTRRVLLKCCEEIAGPIFANASIAGHNKSKQKWGFELWWCFFQLSSWYASRFLTNTAYYKF